MYICTDQVQATVKDYSYICTTYVGLVEGLVHVYTYYAYVCMHGNIWTPASHITGRPRPTPPRSIRHMFHSWLANQSKEIRNLIWVGVAAVCWAIWRCRNDIIFNNAKVNSILQVIFRGTYWLRFWAQLQRDEQAKNTLSVLSRNIEIIAMELVKGGWKHNYRLL